MHWNGQKQSRQEERKNRRICFSVFSEIIRISRNRIFFVPEVSTNVIKMSETGQVIKVQSQRNCPLHSKQPLNLYWFWVMQRFQTSVHCPSNCSLFFILPLASQAAFIMGLSHIRSAACVSKCHLQTPTTTFSFYLTSPPFCSWTSPLSPNILCARTTCISSMQKWKLRLWGCTLSLK